MFCLAEGHSNKLNIQCVVIKILSDLFTPWSKISFGLNSSRHSLRRTAHQGAPRRTCYLLRAFWFVFDVSCPVVGIETFLRDKQHFDGHLSVFSSISQASPCCPDTIKREVLTTVKRFFLVRKHLISILIHSDFWYVHCMHACSIKRRALRGALVSRVWSKTSLRELLAVQLVFVLIRRL